MASRSIRRPLSRLCFHIGVFQSVGPPFSSSAPQISFRSTCGSGYPGRCWLETLRYMEIYLAKGSSMKTTEENNKKLVLEAFDTLFNKRDYAAAERYWSPHYIQHSAHIEPGREGLFNLIKSIPPTLRYEAGVIVSGGDVVMVHG